MTYVVMMLLVSFEPISCCCPAFKERIFYYDWYPAAYALLPLLLVPVAYSVYNASRGRRHLDLRSATIFWIGWLLCFGGAIAMNFINRASDTYIIWTGLSLTVIPVVWILCTARCGGMRYLAETLSKSMIAGSFLFILICYAVVPFTERDPKFSMEEYLGFWDHPNSAGILCSGYAVAAAYLLLTDRRHKPLYACSLGLSLSVILATHCRSAMLGLILAIIVGALYRLRQKGLPDRVMAKRGLLCLLLISAVCAASFHVLKITDQRFGNTDLVSVPIHEQTEQVAETSALEPENQSTYDRINALSSDRLTIWNAFVPRLTPLGNGKIEGPLTEANPASYSAHNNVIEVLYVSGYIAGAGMIIWLLYCLWIIGRSLIRKTAYYHHVLFFVITFPVYFSEMMLDVMQYPSVRPATLMVFLAMGGVAFSRRSEGTGYPAIKRVLDILVGIVGSVLLLPVMAIVKALQLAMGDRGKLFYTQTRIGFKGRPFKIYKFRTMVTDADQILEELLEDKEYRTQWEDAQKLENDPRITKLGRILRRTSIDELPQLLNVLKGEMSLIGPRPLVPGELEEHGGLPVYRSVRPGMTGWWICHGHQHSDYGRRLELEYYYIRHRSLWIDTVCLFKTMGQVLVGRRDAGEEEEPIKFESDLGQRVTVIVPTLNGEDYLPALLRSLHSQSLRPHEIIVIDSSSSDNTGRICADDPEVTLIEIPRDSFDHGGSRDLAVKKSSGDTVVFLTQDATPVGRDFLRNLVAPLAFVDVAVSTGRQIARSGASAAEKLIREYNYPDASFVRSRQDIDRMGIKTFFVSNVCAAYKKDIYHALGGFERVKTNEDMFFAAKAIHGGYRIAYNADAAVYHSHDLSWHEQYERNRIQGYEIEKHSELLGDVPIEREGKKMVNCVLKELIAQGRFGSAVGFVIDCSARFLGSRIGRQQGR